MGKAANTANVAGAWAWKVECMAWHGVGNQPGRATMVGCAAAVPLHCVCADQLPSRSLPHAVTHMPPELLSDAILSKATDAWSFGGSFYPFLQCW